MNKTSSKVVMLVVAVILAVVATTSVVLYLNGANARAAAGQSPKLVWFVSRDIPRGMSLGTAKANGYLTQDKVPARSVPSLALLALGADNLMAGSDLKAGDILLKDKFVAPASMGPRLLNIPAGYLAASADLKAAQRVGVFVQPGDYVSVFQYSKTTHKASVLFPKAQVLGSGIQNSPTDTVNKNTKQATTVVMTLALVPTDALKLAYVQNSGDFELQFALLPAKGSVASNLSYGG